MTGARKPAAVNWTIPLDRVLHFQRVAHSLRNHSQPVGITHRVNHRADREVRPPKKLPDRQLGASPLKRSHESRNHFFE